MSSSNAAAPTADPLIGKVVQGRFQVVERLAAGGMGVVYKAIQQPLGRPVAFKVLELASGSIDASFQQRFFLEASAAAKLGHPNTIVVHDYGKTDEGQYFIAMEYLDGGSLGDRLDAQGPLQPVDAVHVGLQIVSSLRDAHEQGLVHRDLKPGNVMFAPRGGDPFFVKVLDFGLVKVLGETGQANLGLTQSGVMMGSPRYMAPEQVRAQPVDARTDIYSFGAVLYHMLTGSPPFRAGSAFEAMNHHVYTPAPPLRAAWAHCPASPELEAVVLQCLAKDPAARFQSMDQVLQALRAHHGIEVGSSSMSTPYLMGPRSSTSTGDSNPALARSGVALAAPQTPQFAGTSSHDSGARSGARSGQGGAAAFGREPSRLSSKTVMFDDGVASSSTASSPSLATAAPARSGGGALKVVLGLCVLLGLAGVIGAAAFFLPGLSTAPAANASASAPNTAPTNPATTNTATTNTANPAATNTATTNTATTNTATTNTVQEPSVVPPAAVAVAPPAEPALAARALTLRSDPPGARVRRDGEDLGDTPIPLLIPPGERWQLEITHTGYETRTVVVAGGQPELMLHLTPARGGGGGGVTRRPPPPMVQPLTSSPTVRPLVSPSVAPPPPRTTSPSRTYAPDLDDPWAGRR